MRAGVPRLAHRSHVVLRHRLLALAVLAAVFPLSASGQNDSEFYATPKTAPEFWRAARFELRTGSYERAAERIKGLLDLNPDDKTLFDLVDKPVPGAEAGIAQFLRLRNVPQWNANPTKDKEAKKNVDDLIAKITKAIDTELSNPDRIRRYANALSASPEESAFALKELRRSGKAVPPVLVTMLGEELREEIRAGLLATIPLLAPETVPGFLAFLPSANAATQAELIDALLARSDYRELQKSADTDPIPTLWYLIGKEDITEIVKSKSKAAIVSATLKELSTERDPELRTPHGQLVAYARQFYKGTSNLPRLASDNTNEARHNVWVWDGKTLKETPLTRAQATEYYGLKYARWALLLQPESASAQKVFLALAIEHHVLRGGGRGTLAKTSPFLYAALATAPFELLVEMLEESLRDKQTAIVYGVVRVLAERSEVKAGRAGGPAGEKAGGNRPPLLVKALDYPDPRVQFAAADALLRMPGTPTHGRNAQIVKILAATVAADPGEGAKQKALIVDPDRLRAESVGTLLQKVGYDVEVIRTGRDLMRRIQAKADADLIIVDRHVPDPMLTELLTQLRADFRGRTLPVMVVASPEGIAPMNLLTVLARLATVLSFEDLPDSPYEAFPTSDEKLPAERAKDLISKIAASPEQMSRTLMARHAAQVKVMREAVQKAGFNLTPELEDRIAFMSLQTFPVEILNVFARQLLEEERVVVRRLLPPMVREEMGDNPIESLRGRIAIDDQPSKEQIERIVKLMRTTLGRESFVPADRLTEFNKQWDSLWNPDAPRMPQMNRIRYPEIEASVVRTTSTFHNVRMLPAVFTEVGFRDELGKAGDATAPPLTPAEKKENAKIAMAWLRKMAIGELAGYQVNDAEKAMRGALASDDLAPLAIDAVARVPSKDVQLDLANLAVAPERPIPVRTQATAALVGHIQTFGRFVTVPQADAIRNAAETVEDVDLKARLLAAQGILQPNAKLTGERLKNYVPKPPEAKEEVPPAKEKEDPKEKDPAEKK
jgi:CheY-like chemotaxis protein